MNFSVALTEDNSINRNTFMQKINGFPQFEVLFYSTNGHECLEQLKGMQHQRLPQVIFMDIEMPEMDGIETIYIAKSLYPQIHFIVLTVFDDDEKIFEAIRAGASGYLLKHEPASVLHDAIINVMEFGGAPMSPAIARKTMQLLNCSTKETPNTAELEILQYMVKGWDAKRISVELNVSILTIRRHVASIYKKLHVNNKAQVISFQNTSSRAS
jgi:DNA-binding NarL/FixJ family response regulator